MLTGMTNATKCRERWAKNAPDIRVINNQTPEKRVATSAAFLLHCRHVSLHLNRLREFYGARRFTRQKLKAYIGKQRTWNEVLKRITGGDRRTVVAFGSAKFRHNSAGGPSPPLNRMLRELKRRCIVRMIDEFRTSITCSKCDGQLPKRSRLWQGEKLMSQQSPFRGF